METANKLSNILAKRTSSKCNTNSPCNTSDDMRLAESPSDCYAGRPLAGEEHTPCMIQVALSLPSSNWSSLITRNIPISLSLLLSSRFLQ